MKTLIFASIAIQLGIYFLIKKNLKQMKKELQDISDDLSAANSKLDAISTDIANLDAKIQAAGDQPTAEEWAAVKQQSADLVAKATGIDELTPDETTGGGDDTGDTGGDTGDTGETPAP